jgi:hypothetical protein
MSDYGRNPADRLPVPCREQAYAFDPSQDKDRPNRVPLTPTMLTVGCRIIVRDHQATG